MQGYDVLYLPGMDHAGIATQAKVDKKLREEGISRYDLGREKFLDVAWEWKKEYAGHIRDQWAALGLSLDYEHERFTLDENLNKTVVKVFKELYDKGLIYQGVRIVNWDTEENTALSDIEIEHRDTEGALYYITYPFKNEKGGITVATTRPETMFADQAVMVNPDDKRYTSYISKDVIIPGTHTVIPVISDSYVDMAYGTGAVKVTPAHDPNDYLVGERHHLSMPNCIDFKGKITALGGKYEGMDRFECRKELVEELKASGVLIKVEPIVHSVGYSERTGSMVEPMISKQWFVKMKPLAEKALRESKVNFIPERFHDTWAQWMENVEDWCISRQLWWGHRIPVYYRGEEVYCGEKPEGDGWVQDEDVLDTWFSSALWPFSTLDWYDNSDLFNRRYPTDCLVTGYDIIFFWVSRMIFQSLEFTGKDPFKDCVIHGLIRDSLGRKMSKSLGNGVDPMKEIEKYGCDTLRYFLTTSATMGQDLKYDDEKVRASWNYLNKIWNVARYILTMTEGTDPKNLDLDSNDLNLLDKWMMTKLNTTINKANQAYDRYDFIEAAKAIYDFLYDDLASIYVELSKIDKDRLTTKKVLLKSLVTVLKLLAPITPFITDDIYLRLYPEETSIALSSWPTVDSNIYPKEESEMEVVIGLITKVRTARNDYNAPISRPIELEIVALNEESFEAIKEAKPYLIKFLNPEPLRILREETGLKNALSLISDQYKVDIPLKGLIDKDEKLKALKEELEKCDSEISRSNGILSNSGFLSKAPKQKVDMEKDKLEAYLKTKEHLLAEIEKTEAL